MSNCYNGYMINTNIRKYMRESADKRRLSCKVLFGLFKNGRGLIKDPFQLSMKKEPDTEQVYEPHLSSRRQRSRTCSCCPRRRRPH